MKLFGKGKAKETEAPVEKPRMLDLDGPSVAPAPEEPQDASAKKQDLLARLKSRKGGKKAASRDNLAAAFEGTSKRTGFQSKLKPTRKEKGPKTKTVNNKKLTKRSAFVFVAGDEGAILIFLQNGKVARRLFAPGPEKEHFGPLQELLEKNAKVPLYFFSDMIDQSYVRHTLPPVSAMSVNKLVNRRLERDFSPDDIKGSLALGREKTGRKEWNYLLISLASSATLKQWLDPLLELPNRFKGIYLLPVEAQFLIAGLSDALVPIAKDAADTASKWKLLVVHDKVGGIRQVVLREGQLIFTRLTQAGDNIQPEIIAGNIEQEILNTIEYLRRLSFDESAGLDVFMIIGHDIKEVVDIHRVSARNLHLLTPFEASQVLGLEQAALSGDRFADVVMGAYFGLQKKNALKLNSAYAQALEKMYQAQLGIKVVAGLGALGLLYMIATTAMGYFESQETIKTSERELAGGKVRLQEAESKAASLDENRSDVADMAALYRATRTIERAPDDFITRLSAIKPQDVFVEIMTWKTTNLPVESAVDQSGTPPTPLGYEIVMTLEFTGHNNSRATFFEQASTFMRTLEATFTDYTIEHSELAGDTEVDENLVVNFEEADKLDELQPEENIVEVTLKGPKVEDPNAVPAGQF